MLPSSQRTTSFENSGRLRNSALANLPCLLTNDLSCPTLKNHTVAMKPGDSLSLFREGLTRTPWGNPDCSLSEGLSRSNSLKSKGRFPEVCAVMEEYFEQGHAESVPEADLDKPCKDVFYLPMHAVMKKSSTTTKVRAVFDASAKSSTGVSLNDQLMVGLTVHSSLIDVLLHFRNHQIALTMDVSRMYRAILLPSDERDLHRFVWRRQPSEPLKDYRMTRVTF